VVCEVEGVYMLGMPPTRQKRRKESNRPK